MEYFANHELVWITIINGSYVDLTKNFLESMKRVSCGFKLIVYFIDSIVQEELLHYDNCVCLDASIFLKTNLNPGHVQWGDLDYIRLCFAKLDAILYTMRLLHSVKTIIYIDTDIVLFSDPSHIALSYQAHYPDADIIAQCDEGGTVCSESTRCPSFCAGIMIIKNKTTSEFLFQYTDDDVSNNSSDQSYMNDMVKKYNIPHVTVEKSCFMNGAYTHAWNTPISEEACLLHFNYIVGNKNKIDKMKSMGLWYLS
jgi:hypothetical protein